MTPPPAMHLTMTPTQPAQATERPDTVTAVVKFGGNVLYRFDGTRERTDWWAAGMARRFAGLRVTDLDGNDWKRTT